LEFVGGFFPATRGQVSARPSRDAVLSGRKLQLGRSKAGLGVGEQDHLQQPIPRPTDYPDGEVDFYELAGADDPTSDVRAMIWSTSWLSKPRSGTLFDFVSLPTVIDEFNASACCHPAMEGLGTDVVSPLAADFYPAITSRGTDSPAEFGSMPDAVDCAHQCQSALEGGQRSHSMTAASRNAS
jgi:hypothetical protein